MTLDQVKIDKQKMITGRTTFKSKSIPGNGLYSCVNCSVKWLLEDYETLPECPECSGLEFQKEYKNASSFCLSISTSSHPLSRD